MIPTFMITVKLFVGSTTQQLSGLEYSYCTLPFATQLMDSLQRSRIPYSSFHQLRVRADNLFSTSGRSQGRGWAIILIIQPSRSRETNNNKLQFSFHCFFLIPHNHFQFEFKVHENYLIDHFFSSFNYPL